MTPEEAIKTIQVAVAEVEWNYPMYYAEAFETAIKALEKQIPKKPKIKKDGYRTISYDCPYCGRYFVSEICGELCAGMKYLYCFNCGQKIDWRETE